MRKKLTITIDEEVYEGLHRVVGRRRISSFLEALARPHVVVTGLDAEYAAMAADEAREADSLEWAEALAGETLDEEPSDVAG
jgi:predicted CopG family antitoxin